MNRSGSDDHLMRLSEWGDERAFGEFVCQQRQYAYGLCRRMLANHHAAEDASQEAFVRAWAALGSYRGSGEAALRGWFRRILINVCLNWRRSAGRRGTVPLEHEPAADESRPELEISESQAQLQRAIDQLPQKQRSVIVLHYMEGLSISEVADLLAGSEKNVRTNLSLARQSLREKLGVMSNEVRR